MGDLREEASKTMGWWGLGHDCYPEKTDKVIALIERERTAAVKRYQELQHEELVDAIVKSDKEARIDELQKVQIHDEPNGTAHYIRDRLAKLQGQPQEQDSDKPDCPSCGHRADQHSYSSCDVVDCLCEEVS